MSTINTDINILGGLPDWNLVTHFLMMRKASYLGSTSTKLHTTIKTDKAIKRFEKAVSATLLSFINNDLEALITDMIEKEGLTNDTLLLLFWNASYNNLLLQKLNEAVFFPAFYSGRSAFKSSEVAAYLNDAKNSMPGLKQYSKSTLDITSSKYLTLLRKFGLLEGTLNKTILHPYLSDKMFVIFIYWLKTIEKQSNILPSEWLKYSFLEMPAFTERALQKKHSKYFNMAFTGDRLEITPIIPYNSIYSDIAQPGTYH